MLFIKASWVTRGIIHDSMVCSIRTLLYSEKVSLNFRRFTGTGQWWWIHAVSLKCLEFIKHLAIVNTPRWHNYNTSSGIREWLCLCTCFSRAVPNGRVPPPNSLVFRPQKVHPPLVRHALINGHSRCVSVKCNVVWSLMATVHASCSIVWAECTGAR